MKANFDELKAIAVPRSPEELAASNFRMENAYWLPLSVTIALKIRNILRLKNISKEELAILMSISVPEIEEYLSGKYNFDIKTIAKLQTVLEEPIMEIDLLSELSGCDKLSEELQSEGNNNLA